MKKRERETYSSLHIVPGTETCIGFSQIAGFQDIKDKYKIIQAFWRCISPCRLVILQWGQCPPRMRRVLHTRPPGMLIEQCNLQGWKTESEAEKVDMDEKWTVYSPDSPTCGNNLYNTAIYFCLHSQQSRQAMLRQRWLAPTGCQGQPEKH